MTNTEARPFEEYEWNSCPFHVRCEDLVVSRVWRRERDYTHGTGPELSTQITGTAVLYGSVGFIDIKGIAINRFDLAITSDAHAEEEWKAIRRMKDIIESHKQYNAIDDTAQRRIRSHIFEEIDKKPPTAFLTLLGLGCPSDEQIQEFIRHVKASKKPWGTLECKIPASLLAELERELADQRAHELHLTVEWISAPVKAGNAGWHWGLFRVDDEIHPEALYGQVTKVKWHVSSGSHAVVESPEADQQAEQRPK